MLVVSDEVQKPSDLFLLHFTHEKNNSWKSLSPFFLKNEKSCFCHLCNRVKKIYIIFRWRKLGQKKQAQAKGIFYPGGFFSCLAKIKCTWSQMDKERNFLQIEKSGINFKIIFVKKKGSFFFPKNDKNVVFVPLKKKKCGVFFPSRKEK